MIKIKYLVLLIFTLVSSEAKREIIDEREAREKEVDIDVDSCGVHEYHEYYDGCTLGVHPNDVHRYSLIPPCCGELAYASNVECDGTDKNGKEYIIENVYVCQDLNNGEKFLKSDFGCPKKCTLDRSIILDPSLTQMEKIVSSSYIINEYDQGFNNTCLSYSCEYGDNDYGWELTADICKCPDEDNLKTANKELKIEGKVKVDVEVVTVQMPTTTETSSTALLKQINNFKQDLHTHQGKSLIEEEKESLLELIQKITVVLLENH